MFDSKHPKSSLSNAFMVSAIAFVLLMGTGYNSMQSFGLDYNGIGDFSAFNGLTQSAECAGLGQDCSEDNRVTNPPEPTPEPTPPTPEPTPTCEECFTSILTPTEISDIESGYGTCQSLSTGTVDESVFRHELVAIVGIDETTVNELIECLKDTEIVFVP